MLSPHLLQMSLNVLPQELQNFEPSSFDVWQLVQTFIGPPYYLLKILQKTIKPQEYYTY